MASTSNQQAAGKPRAGNYLPAPGRAAPRKGSNIGTLERIVSLAGGGALAWSGWRRRDGLKLPVVLSGGLLVLRGATGRSLLYRALGVNRAGESGAVRIERTGTIDRPASELYGFWRDFSNLPRFMQHLESVTLLDDRRSRWVAKAPAKVKVEWEAELVEDAPGQAIAWRSLPGSQVENSGRVTFKPASGGRGTEVKVVLDYKPPAGSLGAAIAKFTGQEPAEQVREDLRHFKMLMESGQIISTEGQPTGRKKK